MARTNEAQPAILQLLSERHFLSGPDIVDQLESRGSGFHKTTVYRALDQLLDAGKVCRMNVGEQTLVYELRDHHHDHLVCQDCGRVVSVECAHIQPADTQGYVVDHHHATFFGLCADCQ